MKYKINSTNAVILADLAFVEAHYPGDYTEVVEVAPVVTEPRYISVGAFFDRFGTQKYPILASTDAGVKALIQDVSVRKYIDLDNPQLPYGLDMLIAAGFVIDKTAILTAEILPSEKP